LPAGGTYLGVLVLTQSAEENAFPRLASSLQGGRIPDWKLEAVEERDSILAIRSDGVRLLLVAGVQLVTTEGLEVLGVAASPEPCEKRPLEETLELVRDAGGLPILAWGFGKWWGRRAKVVLEALRTEDPSGLFVSDSGVRPNLSTRPRLLQLSRKLGFRNLPGTDLFPVAGDEQRAGSFGSYVPMRLSSGTPLADLLDQLRSAGTDPKMYGRGLSCRRFLRFQASALWKKHAPEILKVAPFC